MIYYKVARPDGWDFHTGKTINYKDSVGKVVKCPKTNGSELCSSDVIHASEFIFQALSYGQIPCSAFIVEGTPVSSQLDKHGFKEFKVIKDLHGENIQKAYQEFVIWMLEDVKQYTNNDKKVITAIECVIDLFAKVRSGKTVTTSEWKSAARSAAWSARSAARSAAESAAWSAAWSARSAWSAAESAARSAWSAAESAARSAWSAAWSAADSAAWSARSAESAESAADSAAWAAKTKQLNDKFLEILESYV